MFWFTEYDSPVGRLTLASDGEALCGLWLEGQKYFGAKILDAAELDDAAEPFAAARVWLDAYFAGERPEIESLPLAPRGSAYQLAVWQLLREIPYGEVTTYGEIAAKAAARLGKARGAALAAGGAVGHNPISIIVPCHRVVGADGSLTGFAGGIAKKKLLLEHEGVDMTRLYVPTKGTAL